MDYAHIETEKILKKTERDIQNVYSQAQRETQAKLDNYLDRFKIKDDIKKRQVHQGKLTQEQYEKWRHGQICVGKRWQEMVDTLAQDYTNADRMAMEIVNGYTPGVYAENHNYATFQVEKGSRLDTSYTLYDKSTVNRLIRDDPDVLPKARVDIPKDKQWNRTHIKDAVTQGILQGEDLRKVSKRLQKVTDMDNRAAMRNARTIITATQNAGRVDSYKRAENMGIKIEQEWLATLDNRTRHSHRKMDGQHVKVGEKFPNGCEYPGDPNGPPAEVYNCRCTLVPRIEGVDQSNAPRNDKLGNISYDEWKNEHNSKPNPPRAMVDGKDITDTWVWDPDKFTFAIDSAVHEQGFDGLPRVVSADEFDQLYVGGEQPFMLRTYSAEDEETLAAYRKTLTDGKFYVDCSSGGANYGQGMYTAGIYAEKGSKQFEKKFNGAMEEMLHYSSIKGRESRPSIIETMTLDPSAKIVKLSDLKKEPGYKAFVKKYDTYVKSSMYSEQIFGLRKVVDGASYLNSETKREMLTTLSKAESMVSDGKFSKAFDTIRGVMNAGSEAELGGSFSYFGNAEATQMSRVIFSSSQKWGGLKSASETAPEGVYAALRGYDAINAFGHGASGSYTIVLNKTKLIIKGG